MSDDQNAFEKIDAALDLYYRAVGRYDYYNDDKIGKFIEFCDDNGLDVDDIDEELDDPTSCMYIEFDEDFPFIEKHQNLSQDDKNGIIFEVIKSGYQTGLPPDKYRPRKKNLTRPKTTSLLVDAYLRDIVVRNNLSDIDGKELIIPKVINELCTKYELRSYNLMAPYDFKVNISQSTIVECERLFANLYMYHSKLANKSDYFSLAIGYANKYFPWLFYVLESFDRDRIRRGTIAENGKEKAELKLKDWMYECDFLNEYILQELNLKPLFESIEKVCIFYIRKWKNQMRVLPSKLEMERMYIYDDLYEIVDVVIGIYKFIKWLVCQYPNGTKFSCEFAIGIHSTRKKILTTAMIPDMNDKKKQEEANRAEQAKYKHHDKVGNFLLNMRENNVPYAYREVQDRSKYCEILQDGWDEFKFTIDSCKYPERASTFGDMKTPEIIAKYYSPFPKQRRFCCFIDRREYYHRTTFHKQLRPMMMGGRGGRHGKMMDMGGFGGMFGMMGMYEWVRKDTKMYRKKHNDIDEITFFIPDDQYLPFDDGDPKNGIYPESYFDIAHQSMIPELRIYDDQREDKHLVSDRISGITSLSGGMFNLLFQVERHDEIRMYLHWHNQCIRLHPSDFWLVLPRIFVTGYKNNSKFADDLEIRKKILKNFQMPDKYFEYFYKYMSVYNQQKKEWIDKPTELKYVN